MDFQPRKSSSFKNQVSPSANLYVTREAQYERHLKKWGFSKNQKKDVWEVLSRKVEKRKREGKESEVYLDNQLVKTAKRQLVRYKPTETLYGKVLEPHQGMTQLFLYSNVWTSIDLFFLSSANSENS